jgi:protein tyrosine phosphatase (PTP) superfamily phosphohydrolase (DUF442 family)
MRAGRGARTSNRFATMMALMSAAALAVFALAGSQSAPAQSRARDAPANFVQWRAGLASSAQPDAMYLSRVKDLGYAFVINLAPAQSMGSIASEGTIVRGQGVLYLNIPVDFDKPTADDFKVFSETMRANAAANVLVHCQVNMRGSAFVYLYRVIYEGASPQEEASKLTGVWVPNRVWKRFIDETLAAHGKKGEIL